MPCVISTDFCITNLVDRNCDQPTSTTTSVVDHTAHIRPTTPAHHHGREPPQRMNTQVLNGKSDLVCHPIGHIRFPISLLLQPM